MMKMPSKRPAKKWVKIMLVPVVLILILLLLRGWIRETVVRQYTKTFYGTKVVKDADALFGPLNLKFEAAGLNLKRGASPLGNEPCPIAYYHNFQETVTCGTYYEVERNDIDEAFKVKWERDAPAIDKLLTAQGWTHTPPYESTSIYRPLQDLFTASKDFGTADYFKKFGKAHCEIYMSYNVGDNSMGMLYADESCNRDVKFFGGSDELYDTQLLFPSL